MTCYCSSNTNDENRLDSNNPIKKRSASTTIILHIKNHSTIKKITKNFTSNAIWSESEIFHHHRLYDLDILAQYDPVFRIHNIDYPSDHPPLPISEGAVSKDAEEVSRSANGIFPSSFHTEYAVHKAF